jgi:hypothetical protein
MMMIMMMTDKNDDGNDDDNSNDDDKNAGSVVVAAASGSDYNYDYDDYDYDEQQKASKSWMKTITQQGDSYVVHEVSAAACVKTATYYDVMPSNLVHRHQYFRGICCLHFSGGRDEKRTAACMLAL